MILDFWSLCIIIPIYICCYRIFLLVLNVYYSFLLNFLWNPLIIILYFMLLICRNSAYFIDSILFYSINSKYSLFVICTLTLLIMSFTFPKFLVFFNIVKLYGFCISYNTQNGILTRYYKFSCCIYKYIYTYISTQLYVCMCKFMYLCLYLYTSSRA